jgi:hypothetical protein
MAHPAFQTTGDTPARARIWPFAGRLARPPNQMTAEKPVRSPVGRFAGHLARLAHQPVTFGGSTGRGNFLEARPS